MVGEGGCGSVVGMVTVVVMVTAAAVMVTGAGVWWREERPCHVTLAHPPHSASQTQASHTSKFTSAPVSDS